MATPAQVLLATAIIVIAWLAFMFAVVNHATYGPRIRAPKTRFHWNDERQIAKLRHPSARADVWECWDTRCDCHLGRSLPYDWKYDNDLT